MPATAAMLAISIGSGVVQNQASQKAKGVSSDLLKEQQKANDALTASETTTAANQAQASLLAGQVAAQQKKKALGAQGRSNTILTSPAGVTTPPPGSRVTLLGL